MGAASRDFLIKKDNVVLMGITSKSVAVAKTEIDITSDEDGGFRTLLPVAGVQSLDITFGGVTKDRILRGLIMTGGSTMLTDIEIVYPPVDGQTNGDTITGNFYLNGLNETGDNSDTAIGFDGTLMSSGAWTYTVGT